MRVFTVRKTDILLWGFQWFARKRNTLRLLQRVVNWLSTFPVTNTNSLCVLVCRRPLTRYTCPSVRLSRVCATNWLCRYTIVLMYCLTGGRPAGGSQQHACCESLCTLLGRATVVSAVYLYLAGTCFRPDDTFCCFRYAQIQHIRRGLRNWETISCLMLRTSCITLLLYCVFLSRHTA